VALAERNDNLNERSTSIKDSATQRCLGELVFSSELLPKTLKLQRVESLFARERSFNMASAATQVLTLDSCSFEPDKFCIPLSNCVELNLYSSTKPHNLKIATLQKGLVLACVGKEQVGEGAGFGFPVVVYPEETVFPGTAHVTLHSTAKGVVVRKVFGMDRTDRNRVGRVCLENRQARAFVRHLCALYQKNKRFRFLPVNEALMNLGVETTFRETDSVGEIPVTYTVSGDVVDVQVDLTGIKRGSQRRFFVLNEQSAMFFRRYSDSEGLALVDGEIDAWSRVDAEDASLTDLHGHFGFKVWQAKDAVLHRGRETMRNCLDWVGLDYELDSNVDVFEYRIGLFGAK
jgi:hypothetical protein